MEEAHLPEYQGRTLGQFQGHKGRLTQCHMGVGVRLLFHFGMGQQIWAQTQNHLAVPEFHHLGILLYAHLHSHLLYRKPVKPCESLREQFLARQDR